jgi:hypothetical protein
MIAVRESLRDAADVGLAPDEIGGRHRTTDREVRRGSRDAAERSGHVATIYL